MGDKIENLPLDSFPPSKEEKEMSRWLFGDTVKELKKTTASVGNEFLKFLYLGGLFLVCSLPVVDSLIRQFIPFCRTSWVPVVLVKTVLFILLFWIFCNATFLKKND